VRWENLRDSIENFEKVRVLRESGAFTPELEKALEKIDYTKEAANANEYYFIKVVDEVEKAIINASRKK
jgi:DNA integrity scanning protein DisA with diadenylate cyclase activity